eukprot:1249896-Rhodomonas_salina.1
MPLPNERAKKNREETRDRGHSVPAQASDEESGELWACGLERLFNHDVARKCPRMLGVTLSNG